MVNTPEGLRLLYAYDIHGVKIAEELEKLYNNPKTKGYAESIVNQIIVPYYFDFIVGYLQHGHYETAMYHYLQMSSRLGNIVGVRFDIPDVDVNTLDKQEVGHGRKRVIE
jgi:hypothetical protein